MSSWDVIMLLSFCQLKCSQVQWFLPSNAGSCGIWQSIKKGQWKDLTLNNMCFFNLCFLSENKSQFFASSCFWKWNDSEVGIQDTFTSKEIYSVCALHSHHIPKSILTFMKENRNWYDHIEHTYNVSGWKLKRWRQRKVASSFETCVAKSFNKLRMQQHQNDKMPGQ